MKKKILIITSIFLSMVGVSSEWELDTHVKYIHKLENQKLDKIEFKETPSLDLGTKLKYSPDDINLKWYLDIHNSQLDVKTPNWADYQLKTGINYESHDIGSGFKLNTSVDIGIYDKKFTGTTDITFGFRHTTKNNFDTSLKAIYNAVSFVNPLKIGAEFKLQQNFEKGNVYTVLKPMFNLKEMLDDMKADNELKPVYLTADFNIGGKFNNELLTYSPRIETTTDIKYKGKKSKYSINVTPAFNITLLDLAVRPINGLELKISNTTTLNYVFNKEITKAEMEAKFQNVVNDMKFNIKYTAKLHSTFKMTPNIGFNSLLEYRTEDVFTKIKGINDLKYIPTDYLFVTRETVNVGLKLDYTPNEIVSLSTKIETDTNFNINHKKDKSTSFEFISVIPRVNFGINLYW